MKDKTLVPKNTSSTQETKSLKIPLLGKTANDCPVGTKNNMVDALRKDMRSAAEYLLVIRHEIGDIPTEEIPKGWNQAFIGWLDYTDKALAALDCIDHIPVIADGEIEASCSGCGFLKPCICKTIDKLINLNLMRKVDHEEDVLENLVQEAIDSGDYAILKHDESEPFCSDCGGFSGCACEGGE